MALPSTARLLASCAANPVVEESGFMAKML
jgi:hypothetical protein